MNSLAYLLRREGEELASLQLTLFPQCCDPTTLAESTPQCPVSKAWIPGVTTAAAQDYGLLWTGSMVQADSQTHAHEVMDRLWWEEQTDLPQHISCALPGSEPGAQSTQARLHHPGCMEPV